MSDREQKNEKRETLAGIVADMRGRGEDGCMDMSLWREYADRIEAAAKREEAERKRKEDEEFDRAMGVLEKMDAVQAMKAVCGIEHPPVGNAAAMREALVGIRYLIADEPDGTPMIDAMKAMTDAALAAPARNCDLPLVVDGPANNNADKAWLVFKRHNPDAYFDASGLLRCIYWLLAPAAERKGEEGK